jgi:hypothetical protein
MQPHSGEDTLSPSGEEGEYLVPNKDMSDALEDRYIRDYTMLDFGFPKGEKAPYKGRSNGAEEMHIPNYIMLDFGFPEGTPLARNLYSR